MARQTILKIISVAKNEMGMATPNTVLSSTNQTDLKLLSLARSVSDDLLVEKDWPFLQATYSFSTTDGVGDYDFPTDMQRALSGTFWNSSTKWDIQGSLTPTHWQRLKVSGISTTPFQKFRVVGSKFSLSPVPEGGPFTITYEYISNKYVVDATNVLKNDFTQDDDVCLFDHRLMINGIKLKWLSSIGQDTVQALADYNRVYDFIWGGEIPRSKMSLDPLANGSGFISNRNIPDGNWMV